MRRLLSSVAIIQLLPFTTTTAFVIRQTTLQPQSYSGTVSVTTTTELPAQKKSNKRSKPGGGGFGGTSSTKTSSSSTTKTISSGKIRTVSGYTGSGTKALRAATNAFDGILKACDRDPAKEKEALSDVYVKSPSNDPTLLWFTGKVVRRLGDGGDGEDGLRGASAPTEFEAVLSQKRLILEWAKNQLRPQNLGGPANSQNLEVWIAPGNSEMDTVQNKISLTKVVGSIKDLSSGFSVADVGFNPEIYLADEKREGGLRIRRDLDGQPIKPEFEITQ